MVQPPSIQSVAEMRTPIGLCAREDAAAEIENLQRQPHPVFKAAAVLIVSLIDDRREELTDQIAVGEMQLDDVDIDLARPGAWHRANRV